MTVRLYEGDKTETGGAGIEITDNKVVNLILRNLNNLIKINSNNEVYVDLQLDDNLQSSATLPVGVTTGRVVQANGRPVTGTLISAKTTSGDNIKILYGDDGEIRVDNGTGTWEILQYEMSAGTGIAINSNEISNTGVLSLDGETGHITSKIRVFDTDNLTTLADYQEFYDFVKDPSNTAFLRTTWTQGPVISPIVLSFGAYVDFGNNAQTYIFSGNDWKHIISYEIGLTVVSGAVQNFTVSNGVGTINDVVVSATAPAYGREGAMWYDTTNHVLKVYDGSQWQTI